MLREILTKIVVVLVLIALYIAVTFIIGGLFTLLLRLFNVVIAFNFWKFTVIGILISTLVFILSFFMVNQNYKKY